MPVHLYFFLSTFASKFVLKKRHEKNHVICKTALPCPETLSHRPQESVYLVTRLITLLTSWVQAQQSQQMWLHCWEILPSIECLRNDMRAYYQSLCLSNQPVWGYTFYTATLCLVTFNSWLLVCSCNYLLYMCGNLVLWLHCISPVWFLVTFHVQFLVTFHVWFLVTFLCCWSA